MDSPFYLHHLQLVT